MTRRLKALTPVALGVLVLTSASTLTFAAVRSGTPATKRAPVVVKKPLVVPDVSGQAYIFAEGILEDAGFAWKVQGSVQGYAANAVSSQSPQAGTIVADTGAPTVSLTLSRNTSYQEKGTPQASAPFAGTPVVLPGQSAKPKAAAKPNAAAKPVAKPTTKPAAKPATKPAAKPTAAPSAAKASFGAGKAARSRPPAFKAPGAPAEPLDEMPLTNRARLLAAWVEQHPKKTDAEVHHWLYQHAWIVYGAKFGWWHGAEALRTLIRVDGRVQQLWGVGSESEASARAALDYAVQRSH